MQQRTAGHELRREVRVGTGAALVAMYNGNDIAVTLRDCSLHGIGVVSPVSMEAGDYCVISLVVAVPVGVAYAVRHCRQLSASEWLIGGQLIGCMTDFSIDAQRIFDVLRSRNAMLQP